MQFAAAIRALCDAEVQFIVIGGLSATLHGSARVTYDLDICYARTAANLRALTAALAPFRPKPRGFPPGIPFIWDDRTLRGTTLLTLQTAIGEIDLLAEVTGLGSFDEVKKHSVSVHAFDRQFETLDLPSLITAKRAANRQKDLLALPELESLLDSVDNPTHPITP